MGAATRGEAPKAFYVQENWGSGIMQWLLNRKQIEDKYVSAVCQALAGFYLVMLIVRGWRFACPSLQSASPTPRRA